VLEYKVVEQKQKSLFKGRVTAKEMEEIINIKKTIGFSIEL